MDVSKSIIYRSLDINAASLQTGRVIRGITVEQVDYSDIEVVGYTEKRAAADGVHASDVYLGKRSVNMSGLIYATSVAELFDYLHTLRSVFSAPSAYLDDPGNKGFLPLYYYQQTADTVSFPAIPAAPPQPAYPAGTVPLYMNLRPTTPLRFSIIRDRQAQTGGKKSTSTPWNVKLIAKDPRVYISPPQQVQINGAPNATQINGSAVNRGDYESPFNIELVIGATAPPANATFHIVGLNNIDMTIKVEQKAKVTYRWMGDDRVLMTEDTSNGPGTAPLVLRMDLVTFATKQRRPMVPASIFPPTRPFSTPYKYWRTNLTLDPGSLLWWGEAFA
jgi:hypothetical protein